MKVYDIFDLTVVCVKCMLCGSIHDIRVKKEDFVDYNNGFKAIQYCFPYLTINERELLISEICGDCFDKLYVDED